MLFSLDRHSPRKLEADEIRCDYNQLRLLIPKITTQRIVITGFSLNQTDPNSLLEQLELLPTDNYTVECADGASLMYLLQLDYPAFIRYPVNDWETFHNLRDLKVSDIYIDAPLCFQSDKIKTAKGSVKIRVNPTDSVSSLFASERHPSSFFIRPNDLRLYEGTIDIIFFCEQEQEREDALFEIYKSGTTILNLDAFIPRFRKDIPNHMIDDDFGTHRLNCGQGCLSHPTTCHICERYINIAAMTEQLRRSKEEYDALDRAASSKNS